MQEVALELLIDPEQLKNFVNSEASQEFYFLKINKFIRFEIAS